MSTATTPSVPKNKTEGSKLAHKLETIKSERLELARRARELEQQEKGLRSLLIDYGAKRLGLAVEKIQPGARVDLGDYELVSKEGRATVAWKEVCEVELGSDFVTRMQENAPRSTSFEIVKKG